MQLQKPASFGQVFFMHVILIKQFILHHFIRPVTWCFRVLQAFVSGLVLFPLIRHLVYSDNDQNICELVYMLHILNISLGHTRAKEFVDCCEIISQGRILDHWFLSNGGNWTTYEETLVRP